MPVDARAQFHAQIDGVEGLVQGIGPHLRVVAGKGAVPEGRVGEEIRRRHRHDEARIVQGLFEVPHNFVLLGSRGGDGDQIVVVEVDPPRADFGQQVNDLHRRNCIAHGFAEGIPARIADGPQAKGEFVLGGGCVVAHWILLGLRR